jgi:tRNA A37 threonylcarbamoyladenosine modification protein TsaB
MAGLDYLTVLAQGAAPEHEGDLAVMTYARRDLVYLQAFTCPSGEPNGPVRVLNPAEAGAALDELTAPAVLGSGLRRNQEALAPHLAHASILDPALDTPTPALLAFAALAAEPNREPLTPCYVRASDAEDDLPRLAAARGLDADEAAKRLARARSN